MVGLLSAGQALLTPRNLDSKGYSNIKVPFSGLGRFID
jgi:hypothetical protein